MKNQAVIIAVVFAVGCAAIVVVASQRISTTKKELERERYTRMETEEKLEKTISQVKSLEGEMTMTQSERQNVQALLEQEKNNATNLRTELEKVNKLNEVLERELKNALVTAPPAPPAETPKGQ